MGFKITAKEIWALVFAVAPFVLYFGQKATVNGVVQYDYNYVGIFSGALAIAVAGYGAANLKGDIGDQPRMPHYLLLGACALVGLYQLLNGASII